MRVSYSSSTAWKFVPPKPKALTPPLRSLPGHGRGEGLRENGLDLSQPGFGVSMLSVGGSTRLYRESATLISPAMPAVHFVWPICDFTEPSVIDPGAAFSSL